MCGPNTPQLQQEKQQQPIEVEQRVETLQEHLNSLETWALEDNKTVQERRDQYAKYVLMEERRQNEALVGQVKNTLTPITAQTTAPGTPVQETVPAKKTYKERKQENKETKLAKKISPNADYRAYRASKQLTDNLQRRDSVYPDVIPSGSKTDLQTLRAFSIGYQKDKKGRAATKKDAANEKLDDQFFSEYASGDNHRRRPYLLRFRKEIEEFPLSPQMLDEAYVVENAAKLKVFVDKGHAFKKMMEDPDNQLFFSSGMLPIERQILENKVDAIIDMEACLTAKLGSLGIDFNSGAYLDASGSETYASKVQESTQKSMDAITSLESKQIAAATPDLYTELTRTPIELEQTEYAELKQIRSILETNPEAYQAQSAAIDSLFQNAHNTLDVLSRRINYVSRLDAYLEKPSKPSLATQALHGAALMRKAQTETEIGVLKTRLADLKGALGVVLQGKELSSRARQMLEEAGGDVAAIVESKVKNTAMRTATPGICGGDAAMEKARPVYQKYINASNEEMRTTHDVPRALVMLKLRESTTDITARERELRGTVFQNYSEDCEKLCYELEKENVPFDYIKEHMKSVNGTNTMKFSSGPGIDTMSARMMDLFTSYATSDAAMEYFTRQAELLKDAEVFEGDPEQIADYMIKTITNFIGSSAATIGAKRDEFKNGAATFAVILAANCNISYQSGMLEAVRKRERDGEPKLELSEASTELLRRHEALVKLVAEKAIKKPS